MAASTKSLPLPVLTGIVMLYMILIQCATNSLAAKTRYKNLLDIKFNMGCTLPQCTNSSHDNDKPAVNFFQVVSSNPENPQKTNFLWSNIGGPPMVITTSSSQDSNLLIDWDVLLNNKVLNTTKSGLHFNVTQDLAIGLLVEKITLFNDSDNSGLFTKDKAHIDINWSDIIWDLATKATFQKDEFLKTQFRLKPKHKYLNGNLMIKLAIPRDYKADRQKEVPHLKLNNQSISVVIIVDGIQSPPGFKNTRLAMTFVVVIQGPTDQISLDTDSESLISDEYTPGVFRIKSLQFKSKPGGHTTPAPTPAQDELNPNLITEIQGQTVTPESNVIPVAPPTPISDKLGFLYWKEVAYTDKRKMISRTIDVFDQNEAMKFDSLPTISPPFYQYFKIKPNTGSNPDYKLYRFQLIYGKGDTSYSSTNFTDFSFVLGLGSAPHEQMFSFLVKIVIFVCFCLPLLVMLAGLGYLMLRRFRSHGDTELLLAADTTVEG